MLSSLGLEKDKNKVTPEKNLSKPSKNPFIKPIPKELLENLSKFQYKSTNDSLFYNYCMSPFLEKHIIKYVPTWIAPNIITVLGLICTFLSALLTFIEAKFDFTQKLKKSTTFIIGINQLIYSILDNLDGKQARRTKSASPFGLLMDHGCDVFTSVFTAFNLSHLFLVGNDDLFSFSAFFGLLVGFYCPTYEEYKIGEMHFAAFNGVDEGNMLVVIMGIILGITGQDWLNIVLFEGNEFSKKVGIANFTFGKGIGLFIDLFILISLFDLYKHTYDKYGFKEVLVNFWDGLIFINVSIIPWCFIIFNNLFYRKYKWLILVNVSLLFARIAIDIQIKVVTMDKCTFPLISLFSNAFLILSLIFGTIENETFQANLLFVVFIVQLIEIIYFIIYRAIEITDYLNINIFKIKPYKKEK